MDLRLGQIPENDAPDEWATPEGAIGPTMSVSTVSGGEEMDPPMISVHVYAGMEFEDTEENRTVTFRRAVWFAFRSDPDRDISRPRDAVSVEFEEREDSGDPGSPRLELSGNEFARRLASGRYENVTGRTEVEA